MPAHDLLTIAPEDVRGDTLGGALPTWAVLLVDRVRTAAASGETVTITAEERMLTPDEVGRRLSMHRSTVSRKIAAGELRSVRVGNRHRIPYSEFLRFREEVMDRVALASAPDVEADLFGDQ